MTRGCIATVTPLSVPHGASSTKLCSKTGRHSCFVTAVPVCILERTEQTSSSNEFNNKTHMEKDITLAQRDHMQNAQLRTESQHFANHDKNVQYILLSPLFRTKGLPPSFAVDKVLAASSCLTILIVVYYPCNKCLFSPTSTFSNVWCRTWVVFMLSPQTSPRICRPRVGSRVLSQTFLYVTDFTNACRCTQDTTFHNLKLLSQSSAKHNCRETFRRSARNFVCGARRRKPTPATKNTQPTDPGLLQEPRGLNRRPVYLSGAQQTTRAATM